MTRILHIIASADPRGGGPIEAAQRFAAKWASQGHSHDLLTLDPPAERHLPNYRGTIFALGPRRSRNPLHIYRYGPHMVPWLRRHARDYDAIIVSGLWRYSARAARVALADAGVPYFVLTHGMLDPWFRKAYPIKHLGKQLSWWLAEGPLLRDAAAILFTCEEEERLAEKAFWPYRVNGVNVGYGTADVYGDPAAQIATFRAAVPALRDRPYLLFLSRIHRKKGCDLLIDAFASVAAQHPTLDLVIAGPDDSGLTPKLVEQARALKVADRIHFPGMLTGDYKFGAYRGAEAFVLTSHQENFGIVVAEAMACLTPVLISDKVNIWREIATDGAGLVEPDTRDGSRTLLARFLMMAPEERAAMGGRARESFVKRFHIDQAAERLLSVMQSYELRAS